MINWAKMFDRAGMPSFGGKIPSYQVWQLVAYVRSLGGLQPKSATSARSDDLHGNPQEQPKIGTGK